jgi:hypothetical protein
MNKLLASVLVGMLAFSTLACAKEESNKAVAATSPTVEVTAEIPKTKKVCVEQKDAKTGKVKEVCKTIKIHKKHEGTEVPTKK